MTEFETTLTENTADIANNIAVTNDHLNNITYGFVIFFGLFLFLYIIRIFLRK